jgi:hypothetical protein
MPRTKAAAAPKDAKNHVAQPRARAEIDSRDQKLQTRTAEIALEGAAGLEVEDLEVIDGPRFKDREAELAFMEEPVTIMIHETTEKNAERLILVAVNGRNCYIPRGKPSIVKRKYVERLAHAREDNVSQDVQAVTPEEVNRLTIRQGHKYPFSVIHDPNPKGADWLRKVMTE